MGDSKSKKTMNKLGKFFGVLSTNLTTIKQDSNGVASSTPSPTLSPTNSHPHKVASPLTSHEDFILSQQENDYVSPLPHENAAKSPLISPRVATPTSTTTTPGNTDSNGTYENSSPILRTSSNDGSTYLSFGTKLKMAHPQPTAITDSNLNKINSKLNSITLDAKGNAPLVPPPNRKSPSISRSSSTTSNPVRKVSSPANKSNPVSRNSSTKLKTQSSHPPNITSVPSSATVSTMASAQPVKPRFKMLDNGNHEHHLRSAKRQEKLSNMLKDLLGAKKLRDCAVSAVPDILQGVAQGSPAPNQNGDKPPTLFAGLVNHIKNNTSPYGAGPAPGTAVAESGTEMNTSSYLPATHSLQLDSRSFVEKYGRCQEVIGRGAFGVVRVSHKKLMPINGSTSPQPEEILYAVKEFKRNVNESDKKYNRRLTSEFCISSSLKHLNIIDTLDLMKDNKGDYCEVMEFCSGGDLYTLIIASGKLEYAEADCFFKQLIRGVNYMHDMGVCHRDLKPENLLLTQRGVIKITDFGNGECFKMAWEDEIQLSEGICGSSPYIAPEEFTQSSFDPRGVDIWACGVIYMAMRTGRQLWKLADPTKDEFFEEYLYKRKDASGYDPIESLKRARCRNVIYSILDPKPERRITGKQILSSEWGREIKVCEAGEGHH